MVAHKRMMDLGPWVGRAQEVAWVVSSLEQGHRLLALIGQPGVGKTRLAMQVVQRWPGQALVWRARAFEGCRCLADIHTTALVQLGVEAEASNRAGQGLERAVSHALGGAGVSLLVLDDAPPHPHLAQAVRGWCGQGTDLHVLYTAAAAWPDAEEPTLNLKPLSLERTPNTALSLAAQLLQEAWKSFAQPWQPQPDHQTLEALAVAAAGLPLALTLTAAQMRTADPHELLERSSPLSLSNPMQPALDRTWRSLSEANKKAALVAALAPEPWRRDEMAQAVAQFLGVGAAKEPLEGLVERFVLQPQSDDHLWMLDTWRAFVLERFDHDEQAAAKLAVAQAWSTLSVETLERAFKSTFGPLLKWCVDKRRTLVAACQWADPNAVTPLLLVRHVRLSLGDGPSQGFWLQTRQALQDPQVASGTYGRRLESVLLRHKTVLNAKAEQVWASLESLEEEEEQDGVLNIWTLMLRARLHMIGARTQEACQEARQAAACAMAAGLDGLEVEARTLVGMSAQWHGALDESQAQWHTALGLARLHGDGWSEAFALCLLAQAEHLQGRIKEAQALYDDAWSCHASASPEVDMPIFVQIAALAFDAECGRHQRVRRRAYALLERATAMKMDAPELVCRALLMLSHQALGDAREVEVQRAMLNRLMARAPQLASSYGDVLKALAGPSSSGAKQSSNVFAVLLGRAAAAQRGDGSCGKESVLVLGQGGAWFELGGQRHDMRRRHTARRVLMALVEQQRQHPGRRLSHEQLIELGWPGERISPESASGRLRVLIHGLRSMGLRDALLTQEGGYALDSALVVQAPPSESKP